MKKELFLVVVTRALMGSAISQGLSGSHADAAQAHKESPFACNRLALSPAERMRHDEELGPALRRRIQTVKEMPAGYAFEFPSDKDTFQMMTEWVAGERVCCPFFDITVQVKREGGPLLLTLGGRHGTKEFIAVDGAAWVRSGVSKH